VRRITVMRYGLKKIFIVFILIFVLISSGTAAVATENTLGPKDETVEFLKGVIDMLEDRYNGEISVEELVKGALRGMFDTLDDYTVFYDPEEAETFLSDMQGNYEGIGVMMSIRDEYITIVKVFPNSPAQRAGLDVGDRIVAVEGQSVSGMALDAVAAKIKGEAGTIVKLGIIKNGESEVTFVDVERASVKYNPVNYEIRGDIGYIQLDVFNSNTYEFVAQALDYMDQNNITKIILDLRGNPGGTVDQAVEVARRFVPEGVITKLAFKSEGTPDIIYSSELKELKYKLAVLVNGMTASASEIIAGAVQDTNSGVIIGTRTFGKSKVQNIIPILTPSAFKKYEQQLGVKLVDAYDLLRYYGVVPFDSEIVGWTKMTTGEYLTPNGRVIDGVGIEPDIFVEDPIAVLGINIQTVQFLQKKIKPGLGSEGIDVLNAEKILKLSGYKIDEPDMVLDQKTFEAIMEYQAKNGLYPYGVLDFTTQQYLNEDLAELICNIDRQYGKAVEILGQ